MSQGAVLSLFLIILSGPGPKLFLQRDGVQAVMPADILVEEEVRAQLRSGLTNTFRIQVLTQSPAGEILSGGALIEVRYELWDEVFIIRVIEANDRVREFEAAPAEFRKWWRRNRLLVLAVPRSQISTAPVRVTLEFIPFSQAEQTNAREWFTESTGTSVADRRTPRGANTPGLFQALMATSIKRKALLTFNWKESVIEINSPPHQRP